MEEEVPLRCPGEGQAAPITVDVTINAIPVMMELDTGAAVSVMSEQQQQEIFPEAQLRSSQVALQTYTGESVGALRVLPVRVTYKGEEYELFLVIVRGNGPALFGRDWLSKICLDWHSITFHTVLSSELERVLQKYQVILSQLLNRLPGVKCYLDNIIITGSNHREHLSNLDRVLERLRDKGLRLKKSKCHCMQTSVEYLGHVLDTNGVHTTPSKQRAIAEARAPSNVTELHSFLGLVNYYGRFLLNVSTVSHPLNRLLNKYFELKNSWGCRPNSNYLL